MLQQPALRFANTCRLLRMTSLLGLLGAPSRGWAQGPPTPLHAFFQQHYDSAVVYHVGSAWDNAPNYLILAKHRGGVDAFTYTSPYRNGLGRAYPGQLTAHFSQAEARFRATRPDTNRYLLPHAGSPTALQHTWQQLRPARLWVVRGDGERPRVPQSCTVDDGSEHVFYLLDKRAIRTVRFYALEEQEACGGPNANRAQALVTSHALRALMPAAR
jgi:hypothetical protein